MGSEDMGKELRENNEKIVECILLLKEQRDELNFIIEKQQEERKKLETEMERITYKLCLINKSLAQRIEAKNSYDKTLIEIEKNYAKLVRESGDLLGLIKKEFDELESMINKKTSTDDAPSFQFQSKHQNGSGERIHPSTSKSKICQCVHKPVKEKKRDSGNKANQAVQAEQEIPTRLSELVSMKRESIEHTSEHTSEQTSEHTSEHTSETSH